MNVKLLEETRASLEEVRAAADQTARLIDELRQQLTAGAPHVAAEKEAQLWESLKLIGQAMVKLGPEP